MNAQTINTKWFRDRLAERDMSLRRCYGFARFDRAFVIGVAISSFQ
jgi:hypothetical protein